MKQSLKIETKRLLLVAGTPLIGRAEMDNRDRFAKVISAELPSSWPPPLNDKDSMTWFTEYMENNADSDGWASWYFLLKTSSHRLTAIGNGGFKGKPDDAGQVEIGYSVVEEYQQRGFATEAVNALVAWAFSFNSVNLIKAQTLPGLQQSIRVLQKCGFAYAGKGTEEGAIAYQLLRDNVAEKKGQSEGS